ncbi:hypothetical protein BCU70_10150 [Vibrio sp. 10N.286.49.C2]|uniref:agmatinase family protein n=1 Tax=unclassified Vibrio TaxID=2614977 RepID=UPI000C856C91|nr:MULTISPECIES: agmatinase family protein [unclassified Vibrio]PMH26498.1 hypothetical protein BCU70_10150 [Vibrio sp. 10N.286.49.C2]PMH54778.1 hypothetical protein BCU66_10785 [Vibrio sp. 10N.286.49.B1]PMH82519.1 hypothetical protein BCU58_18010 [Vibrio sp. 10N.286.48.B7]
MNTLANGKAIIGTELVGENGEIIIHTGDASEGFCTEILRDMSNDPKREAGPINVQRTAGGMAHQGIPTMMRAPLAFTPEDLKVGNVDVAFMGAGIDMAISRRGGAWGPQAFRTSDILTPWGETFDMDQNGSGVDFNKELNMVDYGDAPIDPFSMERSIAPVRKMVTEICEANAIPVIIGGDHSLMYMDLTAVTDVHGKGKVGVIHFDAHVDGECHGFGHYLTHGSPVRRLIDEGHVKGENFVQIGMRGYLFSNELLHWMRKHNMPYHFMSEIEVDGFDVVMERAIKEAKSNGVEKIFISFDMDALDVSVANACASPEVGGLTTQQVLPALRKIAMQNEVVGMDIVEWNPLLDHDGSSKLIANRIVREVLTGISLRRKGIVEGSGLAEEYVYSPRTKKALEEGTDVTQVKGQVDLTSMHALAAVTAVK